MNIRVVAFGLVIAFLAVAIMLIRRHKKTSQSNNRAFGGGQ